MKIFLAASLAVLTSLQGPPPADDRPRAPELEVVERESRIAWYGVWEDAAKEAERSGRPILLMSAAPRCNGVPGMW